MRASVFLHLLSFLAVVGELRNLKQPKPTTSKFLVTFFTMALLISFMLSYAPGANSALPKTELQEVEGELSCEGVGKEECLRRRTLAAHVDYIYTQNHKP